MAAAARAIRLELPTRLMATGQPEKKNQEVHYCEHVEYNTVFFFFFFAVHYLTKCAHK